jgi:hypothetical protein
VRYNVRQACTLDGQEHSWGQIKVYISKKHTQDVVGLDSHGPICHFRKDKDLGAGHAALIGTSERNRSEVTSLPLCTGEVEGLQFIHDSLFVCESR